MWCSALTTTQGQGVGEPLAVWPWEADLLARLERMDGGELALTVAAGAGKTTLAAAICAAAVAGPLAQPRGAVLAVAGSFMQARLVFDHALAFLRPIVEADPERWRVLNSESTAAVMDRENGAELRCREANARTLHGSAPVLIVADEPAQWQHTQAGALYSAIRSRLGKLPGSRLFAIGTRSADAAHWFSRMLDRSGIVYAADPGADWADPAAWVAANPSLPFLPELRKVYEREAAEAAADPSLLPPFLALRCNMGAVDHEVAVLIDAGRVAAVRGRGAPGGARRLRLGGRSLRGGRYAGFACYWPSTGRCEALAAFPELPRLAERSRTDGADYERMRADGDLLILGRRTVPVAELVREALRRWGRPGRIVADYHHERELRDALEAASFPPAVLVTASAGGLKDGPGRIRDFRRAVNGGRVAVLPRLLIRQSLANARTVSDSMGEERMVKGGAPGRKRTARDDVAVCIVMAVSEAARAPVGVRRPRHAVA